MSADGVKRMETLPRLHPDVREAMLSRGRRRGVLLTPSRRAGVSDGERGSVVA